MLFEKEREEAYSLKVKNKFEVAISPVCLGMKDEFLHLGDSGIENTLDAANAVVSRIYKCWDAAEDIWTRALYLNLVFEAWLYGISFEELEKEEIITSKLLETYINNNNIQYLTNALEEIRVFDDVIKNGTKYENLVPKRDWAYKLQVKFDKEVSEKAYRMFVSFIAKCYEKKQDSFLMKYLSIRTNPRSSGERAFQNVFSWINLLPKFDVIETGLPRELNQTLLLLIDEMDLYLHPEWQRSFLANLLEEVKIQFPNYKIQIIFATHSPLCLSDVPRENIVYLKSIDNGVIQISDRNDHEQSFGCDVFTILNDAFFLENGTMGLYAEKYIQELIDTIIHGDISLDYHLQQDLKEKIEYIGDSLLKRKLIEMLEKHSKLSRLESLKLKREQLNKQIALLEAEADD